MIASSFITDIRRKLCAEIEIEPEGVDRFVVYVPFSFDDGDHFVVLLKRESGRWWLTDEGHTLMHMEYFGVDFRTPSRWKVVENALANHGIQHVAGELRMPMDEPFSGDRVYSFIQGLARVSNVTAMTRDFVRSSFMDDFRATLGDVLPPEVTEFDWTDDAHDSEGNYPVDCMVRTTVKPWFIFGVGSDDKCNLTTLTCRTFEGWGVPFQSMVIYRDQEDIGRKPLARLTNVVGKQFSSLDERDLIHSFVKNQILPFAGGARV